MSNLIEAILPIIGNCNANRRVRNNIDKNPKHYGIIENSKSPELIEKDTLIDTYKEGIEQKKSLEDKAKTNVVGVTIAVSLILGANSLLNRIPSLPVISLVAVLCTIFAITYMIAAGIMSIKVITDENQIETIKPDLSETEISTAYDECISKNIAKNIIRNNYVFSSYECIRNSLICLLLVFLISLIPISTKKEAFESSDSGFNFYYNGSTLPLLSVFLLGVKSNHSNKCSHKQKRFLYHLIYCSFKL